MLSKLPLLLADSIPERLVVAGVCCVIGTLLILAGRNNIRTETAEESGKRRTVNRILGRSNTYSGNAAVRIGKIRIVCGVGLIIFGVIFIFTGPFLAR